MDERLEQLMEDVLDGVATAEESEQMRQLLARDPEARARYHEIESLFETLGSVGTVSAPPELRRDVLNEIASGAGTSVRGRTRGPASARFRISRPAVRYTAVFAAGAAAAVFAVAIGLIPRVPPGLPVSGTMLAPQEGAVQDRKTIGLGAARIVAETRRAGSTVWARVETQASGPVEITLSFDPQMYRPVAVEWSRPAPDDVHMESGRLRFERRGDAWCTVSLEAADAARTPIHLTARSRDGSTEEVLRTGSGSIDR